ncbi:MAG: hypothetical protein DCF30_23465 [Hyphomicrobiales bacterium]|nr:MAG: hypothetical protein DCF30_23465 [Hyphomicrobiales bacterium]
MPRTKVIEHDRGQTIPVTLMAAGIAFQLRQNDRPCPCETAFDSRQLVIVEVVRSWHSLS